MSQSTVQPTTTGVIPTLPIEQREWPIHFQAAEGDTRVAYPINYDEVYNLKGRLLTVVDATFTDPEQRKAHKDLIWSTLRGWMDDIEHRADGAHGRCRPAEDRHYHGGGLTCDCGASQSVQPAGTAP